MDWIGLINYGMILLTSVGIFALLAVGLNVQWGLGGLFNAGIAGFFAIGAYTNGILTSGPAKDALGGFALPLLVGWLGAMLLSGLIAWLIGRVCLNLRSDYLAIGTIGIAEIIRLIAKSEDYLTRGAYGITDVPRPFHGWYGFEIDQALFLGLTGAILLVAYLMIERLLKSPWGRMMRAIRDNETAAAALGKQVNRRRLEAFVIGAVLMGLAGALFANNLRSITPGAIDPLLYTFLIWIMLILGGSGNNRGAILGALVVWMIWSMSEILTDILPDDWSIRAKYIRIFLVGLSLQLVLRFRPGGLLPEASGQRQDRSAQPSR